MSAAEMCRISHRALFAALALAALLCIVWIVTLPPSPTWGWDESMHAELPAARMVLALRTWHPAGAFDALLDCQQYPCVWPAGLALVQLVTGISEFAARCAGLVAWAATCLGVFLLALELAPALDSSRGGRRCLPWIAFALAALCPLALDFGGTLFLEVPFTCAAVFTLRAWIRVRREPSPARAYAAGAWIALALFTKWNYGLLLGFGLALDALVTIAIALSRGSGRVTLALFARAALVPAIACLWWFVWPLPGPLGMGGEHRRALLGFLGGNLGGAETSLAHRLLFASTYFAATPRMLLLELAGLVSALRFARDPGVRALVIVLLASGIPVWLHPFHLDRFQIPSGPELWALAALGIAASLPGARTAQWGALALLAVSALSFPGLDSAWVADRLWVLPPDPKVRAYALGILAERRSLLAGRELPSGGLGRDEFDELADLVAREAGPEERIGWLGISSETSPAALHLSLLARGGSAARFLRDAHLPMDLTIEGTDPQVDERGLLEFAQRFDVIFATDPPDLRDRSVRRFMRSYRERLIATGQWTQRSLGEFELARPLNAPQRVTLFACRRKT